MKEYKDDFKAYVLKEDKLAILRENARSDAKDIFFKASLSFLEATHGIINGRTSWAIVKLYYSLFYSLRVIMMCSGHVFLKNGTSEIFCLKLEAGSSPFKVSNDKNKGDHKATIRAYKMLFADAAIINTNKIDEQHVLEWIMSYRELVHYRIKSFIEPEHGYDVLPTLISDSVNFDGLSMRYITDEFSSYCFLEDHSMYATPLFLLNQSSELIQSNFDSSIFSDERKSVLRKIIEDMNLVDSQVLKGVFPSL